MTTFPSMAAPKIYILYGYLQNCSFIRRVPPYHKFFWANFDDFQKMAVMLLVTPSSCVATLQASHAAAKSYKDRTKNQIYKVQC